MKLALRRSVDVLMTLALPVLMAYSLVGETAHEWIGIGMVVLFVLHLTLNRKWVFRLGKVATRPTGVSRP